MIPAATSLLKAVLRKASDIRACWPAFGFS